ncbi:DAPG hydrolase family protein [Clostridium felsineum]|uniref:DAPG hydrolase family protein n=1 Tax=Clostridium felsineum TaxID=36839 RepID=UPI00098C9D4D|nr:phloretin hydrolase [Clostridium felsineum]URZ04216.1 Phloretin hydrolase [Clostridium felsineum]
MGSKITEEEKKLPYAKYFYMDLAEIPKEKLDIWNGGMQDSKEALQIENRNLFLEEEVPGFGVGYCVLENGAGYVANSTYMKDVTPEMFDWWFGWQSVGSDLRYKIWDKEDHYYSRADKPEYVMDPRVPCREKTWGVNHSILEDIGMGPDPLKLCFKKPSDLGYDMSKIGTKGCATMVCAVGEGKAPAVMAHKCRKVDGGIMFESRFWMGYGLKDGKIIKLIPDGEKIPEIFPKSLFGHNIKEFANLAAILPKLYEEEKDNF